MLKRRLKNGKIFEVIINFRDNEVTAELENENGLVIKQPGELADKVKLNSKKVTLPAYSGVIVEFKDTGFDTGRWEKKTCFQRRPMKKAFSGLVFTE